MHDVTLFLPFIHHFIRCYRVCDKSNMKSATFGAGTAYPQFLVGFCLILKLKWLNLRVFYLDRFHCV